MGEAGDPAAANAALRNHFNPESAQDDAVIERAAPRRPNSPESHAAQNSQGKKNQRYGAEKIKNPFAGCRDVAKNFPC